MSKNKVYGHKSNPELIPTSFLQDVQMKPRGIWYSVEGEYGWTNWCTEDAGWYDCLKWEVEIEVNVADMLVLSSPSDLDYFRDVAHAYKPRLAPWHPEMMKEEAKRTWRMDFDETLPEYSWMRKPMFWGHDIDWPWVSKSYKGIVIPNYIWSRRLEPGHMWYYVWDCASGCVWDTSAITNWGKPRETGIKKEESDGEGHSTEDESSTPNEEATDSPEGRERGISF